MSDFKEIKTYTLFAECYDRIMRYIDYRKWAENIDLILRKYGDGGRSHPGKKSNKLKILDLACGTGSLVICLNKIGYKCAGLDISEKMIEAALKKQRAAKNSFLIQDMRNFSISDRFGAAVCLHDSMNYIIRRKDIYSVLDSTAKNLSKGGLFIFDISTRRNIMKNFKNKVFCEDMDGYSFLWKNSFNRLTGKTIAEIEIFIKDSKGSSFGREKHIQRIYRISLMRRLISRNGKFKILDVYDSFTRKEINHDTEEVTFIMRKI